MTNRPTALTRLARRLRKETGLPYTLCLDVARNISDQSTNPDVRFQLVMQLLRPMMATLEVPREVRVHGRTVDEWDCLLVAVLDSLEAAARKLELTTYSDLNVAIAGHGRPPFDFSKSAERAAIGQLLGKASEKTYTENGIPITVLVRNKTTGDLGEGFYKLAASLGLMAQNPTLEQKHEAETRFTAEVYEFFRRFDG